MGLLSRDAMLERVMPTIERVDFGDGDFIFVRQMFASERDSLEKLVIVQNEEGEYKQALDHYRAKLVVHVACDEEGNNLFETDDWQQLSEAMTARRMEQIVNVAQRLNKITDEDIEALAKNSEAGVREDSDSGLH